MEESGTVNLAILYRNELDFEKQTITQELYSQKLLGDQVWKLMKCEFKKYREWSVFYFRKILSFMHLCSSSRWLWFTYTVYYSLWLFIILLALHIILYGIYFVY